MLSMLRLTEETALLLAVTAALLIVLVAPHVPRFARRIAARLLVSFLPATASPPGGAKCAESPLEQKGSQNTEDSRPEEGVAGTAGTTGTAGTVGHRSLPGT